MMILSAASWLLLYYTGDLDSGAFFFSFFSLIFLLEYH